MRYSASAPGRAKPTTRQPQRTITLRRFGAKTPTLRHRTHKPQGKKGCAIREPRLCRSHPPVQQHGNLSRPRPLPREKCQERREVGAGSEPAVKSASELRNCKVIDRQIGVSIQGEECQTPSRHSIRWSAGGSLRSGRGERSSWIGNLKNIDHSHMAPPPINQI